jgi:hypothetical protein
MVGQQDRNQNTSTGNASTQTQVPFHFSAPKDVLFLIHEDGEMLVFALLYGV